MIPKKKLSEMFHLEALKDKKGITNLVIILLIGVALLIMGNSLFGGEKKQPSQPVNCSGDRAAELESKLTDVLKTVKGVDKIKVMIVLEDNGQQHLAENSKVTEKGDGKQDVEETKVVVSGSGGSGTVVIKETLPTIKGVIVTVKTAQEANPEEVCYHLRKAVTAALPVLPHRVEILEQS